MKLVVMGRGGGKTETAVAWLQEDFSRYLVVMTNDERDRLAKTYRMEKSRLLTFGEVLRGDHRGLKGDVGIDNADALLRFLIGGMGSLDLVTITSTEEDS